MDGLSKDQKNLFEKLIDYYDNMFAKNLTDIGYAVEFKHTIDTGNHSLI